MPKSLLLALTNDVVEVRGDRSAEWTLVALGTFAVIWLTLLLYPSLVGSREHLLFALSEALDNPFSIEVIEGSVLAVLFALLAYAVGIGIYFSTRRNWRRREEHGSAKWGRVHSISRKYKNSNYTSNKLLTKNFRIGLDGKVHKRNAHVMVVGGSGAGKTRSYAKPNVAQANSSFVVLDPKGEILRDTGHLLEKQGYEVKVLDLIDMDKSHCYNPFVYLKSDNDVQRLVTNLFKATTPKGAQTQDPFWDTAASMLLLALIFYLLYEAPETEQNFSMVMEMLRAGEVREDDDDFRSILDELFDELELRDAGHIALKYYKDYRSGSAKTLKSIQVTLASRLEKFNLSSLSALTATDELDLGSLGEKKVALFARVPDNDMSFNFLVSILYTQLFQCLFSLADLKYGGSLPEHVHFVLDEFANVALPDDFEKILSVMRSRNISVSIILQNIAQLKALFEKQWESIMGNCDLLLYLGGNEQATHKAVSELLGKETIDMNTFGKTSGMQGNYSTNWQLSGRELLTPDEVRMLDNRYALLFVRGERPIQDFKFDISRHPRYKYTTDGGYEIFEHATTPRAVSTLSVDVSAAPLQSSSSNAQVQVNQESFEILSEKDLEEIFLN